MSFKQEDLAGVKTWFNRGRTVTFKLKQQFDIDELYEWENFSFERSVGQDVSSISCLIRGQRDPSKRKPQARTVNSVSEEPSVRPKILISLKRNDGVNWGPAKPSSQLTAVHANVGTPNAATAAPNAPNAALLSSSVVENVNSFLNGIRATFRQENVIVASSVRSKGSLHKSQTQDEKQI